MVSVVTATHLSRPPYLLDALRSVSEQTYPHWELTLVLDGCDLELPADLGPRVSAVRLAKVGVAQARNHGLGLARGEFVAILDHDDMYLPRHFEIAVQTLGQHPEAVASFASVEVVTGGPAEPGPVNHARPVTRQSVLSGGARPSMVSLVARRAAVSQVGGFDLGIDGADDAGLIYKLAQLAPLVEIEEVTARYRLHDDNWSRDIRAMAVPGDRMLDLRLREALARNDAEVVGYIHQAQRVARRHFTEEAIAGAKSALRAGDVRAGASLAAWALARDPALCAERFIRKLRRAEPAGAR